MGSDGFFGQNIFLLRKARGWSQRQLADFAGVNKHTIMRAEKGVMPRGSNSAKIAFALGIELAELFKDPTGKADLSSDEVLKRIKTMVLEQTPMKFENVDPRREELIALVRSIPRDRIDQATALLVSLTSSAADKNKRARRG